MISAEAENTSMNSVSISFPKHLNQYFQIIEELK